MSDSKDITDIRTPKHKVEQALQLRLEGENKKETARIVGVNRKTVENWSEWGLLTDGEHWDEYIEKHRKIQKAEAKTEELEVHAEEIEDFYDNVREKLRAVILGTLRKMENGKIEANPSDISDLMDLLNRIDNRGERLQALLNRALERWFLAAREVLGKGDFDTLVAKKRQIEVEMLEEVDPEKAETLVEKSDTNFDQYDE